jgi:acetamidase/formamidase
MATGRKASGYVVEPGPGTLHGRFSREYAPVVSIDPGDSVRFRTLDCWWSTGPYEGGHPRERKRVPEYAQGYGHALCGPVEVRGAEPGSVLAVRIDRVRPGTYGTTVAGGPPRVFNQRYGVVDEHAVLSWELDPDALVGRNQYGHTVALRPFMGVMGLPPDQPGEHSTIPPRWHGGNLDCKELVAGSTLYLPVTVEGALFSVGDGHAAQGDGEVGGTAIECPMDEVALTFGVREDLELATPLANTPAGWLTLGLGSTVDEATFAALEAMFALLRRLFGVSTVEAVALASVAVDVRVTQIVNETVGVHAVLPHGAIR